MFSEDEIELFSFNIRYRIKIALYFKSISKACDIWMLTKWVARCRVRLDTHSTHTRGVIDEVRSTPLSEEYQVGVLQNVRWYLNGMKFYFLKSIKATFTTKIEAILSLVFLK